MGGGKGNGRKSNFGGGADVGGQALVGPHTGVIFGTTFWARKDKLMHEQLKSGDHL